MLCVAKLFAHTQRFAAAGVNIALFRLLLWASMLATVGMLSLWLWATIRHHARQKIFGIVLLILIVLGPIENQSNYMFLTEPLVDAAHDGNAATVKKLLSLGADVNGLGDDGRGTALIAAAAENHPDVVQILLQDGANVNRSEDYFDFNREHTGNTTPLQAAEGHPDIVAMLRQAGADK